jgi:hypothetical protein
MVMMMVVVVMVMVVVIVMMIIDLKIILLFVSWPYLLHADEPAFSRPLPTATQVILGVWGCG